MKNIIGDYEPKDELRQIAPELSEMKRGDGFTTPHNYFKEFPDRVFARISGERRKPAATWTWWQSMLKPKYQLAFASVLILIVAGIWYSRVQSTPDPLAAITQDEALEYVLDNLYEFSNEDLISTGLLSNWDATEMLPVSEDDLDQILEDEELIEEMMIN